MDKFYLIQSKIQHTLVLWCTFNHNCSRYLLLYTYLCILEDIYEPQNLKKFGSIVQIHVSVMTFTCICKCDIKLCVDYCSIINLNAQLKIYASFELTQLETVFGLAQSFCLCWYTESWLRQFSNNLHFLLCLFYQCNKDSDILAHI